MNASDYEHAPYVCTECGEVVAYTVDRDDVQPIRYECLCKIASPGSAFPDAWVIEDGGER